MRVLMVSKALVTGIYQRKAEEIARRGVDLTVLVPPSWRDRRGVQQVERRHEQGYTLEVVPVRFNGRFHFHYYPSLGRVLRRLQPHILHMDEEPYNLATWHALRMAARCDVRTTFFAWQNILRRYPPPFRWFEQQNYARARVAIAGNVDAAAVLTEKGYRGEIAVIPQFGVDEAIFTPPAPNSRRADGSQPLRVGYAGGLLVEKGVDLLIQACVGLKGPWQLDLVGAGDAESALRRLAAQTACGNRIRFRGRLAAHQMADFYRELDVLVLPSRTTKSWKEQFGRVLIEAMACGVAVVGSDSGEIPHVIGAGGLIFAENDAEQLTATLQALLDSTQLRSRLGLRGRERVLANYTMAQIAEKTVEVYQALCTSP